MVGFKAIAALKARAANAKARVVTRREAQGQTNEVHGAEGAPATSSGTSKGASGGSKFFRNFWDQKATKKSPERSRCAHRLRLRPHFALSQLERRPSCPAAPTVRTTL